MTQPIVKADGLSRVRGRRRHGRRARTSPFLLDGGAHCALGPSGSGKSTLLNLIAGLDDPTGGTISWPGIGSRQALRPLAVGMIHQFAALIPTLSVAENVALPLLLGGRAEAATLPRHASSLDLAAFADRLPEELSGGQAQRVGVARALAQSPTLLLADEPTGQLDHRTGQATLSVMLDHVRRRATTFVVATHDPDVAERVETLWRMEHGRLIAPVSAAAA